MKQTTLISLLLLATGTTVVAAEESAAPLTVAECVALAREHHPVVGEAEAEVRGAAAGAAVARGARLPAVDLRAGYARHLDPQRLVPASENGQAGVFDEDILAGAVSAALPLYTGGRLSAEVRAALGVVEARRASARRARQEIAAQTAVIAWQRIAQDDILAAVRSSRSAIVARRDTAQHLLEQGKGLRVDVLKLEARLAAIDSTLASEQGRLQVLDRTLMSLLGDGRETPPVLQDTLPQDVDVVADGTETDWLRRALDSRPDLQALRAQLTVAQERIAAARAEHLPTLAAFGSLGMRSTDAFDDQETVGSVGLSLQVPLYAGGRISNTVERQRWAQRAERERGRALMLRIQLEVGRAWAAVDAARSSLVAARRQEVAATEVVRIERQRLDLGQGTTNDLLDAEATAVDAATAVIRAATGLQAAVWQLRLAAGELP